VAGEGGMLITRDPALADRAEIIREKGTDRRRFLRGDVDKYTWQEVGSSYLMSDLLAALVASQWRRLDAIRAARQQRWNRYMAAFASLEHQGLLALPAVPRACEPAFHLFYVRLDGSSTRRHLQAALRATGIEASPHFVPLHLSPYARGRWSLRPGSLPVTEQAAESLLRLPLYPTLTPVEQDAVIAGVRSFFGMRAL
jgi:dTDP-4-amino-4,6-dideoxygalactose transaminase